MKYACPRDPRTWIVICLAIGVISWVAHDVVNSFVQGPLPLKVVTTATDYASIAELIGGLHVNTTSLTNGEENSYKVVATPAKTLAMREADLFIHSGLDLMKASRNHKIYEGQPGNVDCSNNIKVKELPTGPKPPLGHTHLFGNPHYMLDPLNHILVARTIRGALKSARPEQADFFDARCGRFEQQMKKKTAEWLAKMEPYQGAKVAGYHNVLPYFADRFGLNVVGCVEETPGIVPSPSRTAKFIAQMQETGTGVLLANTWADRETVDSVARGANAEVVIFPEWVHGVPDTPDVFAVFDHRVNAVITALEKVKTSTAADTQK